MFADYGVDVAMADIARHAGVSNGTLYNRFPTRDALIEAVFIDRLEALVALAEQTAAQPDPWTGFVSYLTGMCELQAGDCGFNDIAARGLKASAAQPLRDKAAVSLAQLFTNAKEVQPDQIPVAANFSRIAVGSVRFMPCASTHASSKYVPA